MNEELNLIDTIFYFVQTLLEYTEALANNKILSRTIVFVDETQGIYKDGKLFGGYKKALEKINELEGKVEESMEESDTNLRALIQQMRSNILNLFLSEINLINENLQTYSDALDALRTEFSQGKVEEGTAWEHINEIEGIIELYAAWKSSVEGTLTSFGSLINAQNATMSTYGQRLDVLNNTVTNYKKEINLELQSLTEYIESYDITDKVRTILGREMLLEDGLLHDYATITDVRNYTRNSIDTYMNALEPSWTTVVSKALLGENAYTAMAAINASITTITDRLTGLETQASQILIFADWYNENSESLADLVLYADRLKSTFDLKAEFRTLLNDDEELSNMTARIFGYADSQGSAIQISADNVKLEGHSFTVAADHVTGLGDWIIEHVNTSRFEATHNNNVIKINADPEDVYGIKGMVGNTNPFWFKLNGAGLLAYGAIQWDAQGNLTIQGQLVTPGDLSSSTVKFENVYLSNYWTRTDFTPQVYNELVRIKMFVDLDNLPSGTNSLTGYIAAKILEAQFPEGTTGTIQTVVDSYLLNQIEAVNGPFSDYVTNSNMNSAITDAINAYDSDLLSEITARGYIRDEGLGQTISAALYDQNGNPIGSHTLYKALSHLLMMTSSLIETIPSDDPAYDPLNPNAERVIGIVTSASLGSLIDDYISGQSSTIARLDTWATDILGMTSAGWSLGAFINKVIATDSNNTILEQLISTSIFGYINSNGDSVLGIHADLIQLSSDHKLKITSANDIDISVNVLNAIVQSATITGGLILLSAGSKLKINSANDLDVSTLTLHAIIGSANITADQITVASKNSNAVIGNYTGSVPLDSFFEIDSNEIALTNTVLGGINSAIRILLTEASLKIQYQLEGLWYDSAGTDHGGAFFVRSLSSLHNISSPSFIIDYDSNSQPGDTGIRLNDINKTIYWESGGSLGLLIGCDQILFSNNWDEYWDNSQNQTPTLINSNSVRTNKIIALDNISCEKTLDITGSNSIVSISGSNAKINMTGSSAEFNIIGRNAKVLIGPTSGTSNALLDLYGSTDFHGVVTFRDDIDFEDDIEVTGTNTYIYLKGSSSISFEDDGELYLDTGSIISVEDSLGVQFSGRTMDVTIAGVTLKFIKGILVGRS